MKLYVKKMGCNIDNQERLGTDLTNYRYYIYDLELKNGKKLDVLEFMNGARYTPESIKKGRSNDYLGLWFNSYYTDNEGTCRGMLEFDKELNSGNYNNQNTYTKKRLLELVNSISKEKYEEVEEY